MVHHLTVSPVAVWHPFSFVEPIRLCLPTTAVLVLVFLTFSSLSHETFLTSPNGLPYFHPLPNGQM